MRVRVQRLPWYVYALFLILILLVIGSACAPRNMRTAHPDPERCMTRLGGPQYAWWKQRDSNRLGASISLIAIGTWEEWIDTAAVHGGNLVYSDVRIGAERWTRSMAILMADSSGTAVVNNLIRHRYRPCSWWDGKDEWFVRVDGPTAVLWRGRLNNIR